MPPDAMLEVDASAGEAACAFVVEHLAARAGKRLVQARRTPPLPFAGSSAAARLVAERHLYRLPEGAARALAGWASAARPAVLLLHVPTPIAVLDLQARGRRCVSLLDASQADAAVAAGLPAHPLDFALHDLEHLEKFSDASHHLAQVGFFCRARRALEHPRWSDAERGLDARWASDRDHVLSDMNGAAVFLFVALKSRLRLAVARREGAPRGDLEQERACDEALEALLDAFGLVGEAREAARLFGSRHGEPAHANALDACFALADSQA